MMYTAFEDDRFVSHLEARLPASAPWVFGDGAPLPNIRHLKATMLAAELRSVNRAAQALNLSQPAITQAISRIEGEFGRTLFHRHPTGMFLTPAGSIVHQRISRAFQLLETALRSIQQNSGGRDQPPLDPSLLFRSSQLQVLATLGQFRAHEATATALKKTVASVQRNIRALEDRLSIKLVLREGAVVHLTRMGEDLARAAKLTQREIELAREELDAEDGIAKGRLVIGALPLARSYLAPKAMVETALRFPQAKIRLVEGTYTALLEGLRDGDIDILIGAMRDPAPGDDVVQMALFEERLQVVARASHPALSMGSLGLDDLLGFPWVAPRIGSPARRQFDEILRSGQSSPSVMLEAASHMAVRSILLESDCLALISRHQMRYEALNGQLTVLPTSAVVSPRKVGYTRRTDWKPTLLQNAFLGSLSAHCAREETFAMLTNNSATDAVNQAS